MSVIDSLSKGFRTIHKRWWVILVPILLDMLLWLGPQLSVDEIMQETLQVLEAGTTALPSEVSPELMNAFRVLVEDIGQHLNLFSSLRVGTLGVPSLFAWGAATLSSPSAYEAIWVRFLQMIDMPEILLSIPSSGLVAAPVWHVPNEGIWLLLSLLLSLVGILVGSVYLSGIASVLREEDDTLVSFGSRVWRLSARVLGFLVLRIAAILVAGIPFLLIFVLLSALSSGLAILFVTIVMGLVTWLSFYGIFLVSSMAVHGVSVWRALWNTFNIVMHNFWPTLWLFVLINVIGGGLTILWAQLASTSWTTLIGIVGHAYVGSGLVAASFAFYQDRYSHWQEVLAELQARSQGHAA